MMDLIENSDCYNSQEMRDEGEHEIFSKYCVTLYAFQFTKELKGCLI